MNWRIVDEQERQKRQHLNESHTVYYFREYKIMGGFQHGQTNDLILNFQKGVNCSNNEKKYRKKAIIKFGEELRTFLQKEKNPDFIITGMPPHYPPAHALFDNRIELSIRHAIKGLPGYTSARLLESTTGRSELKNSGNRTPSYVKEYLKVNNLKFSDEKAIIVVDDTLISGCSINAVEDVLKDNFPDNDVYFLVWAKGIN